MWLLTELPMIIPCVFKLSQIYSFHILAPSSAEPHCIAPSLQCRLVTLSKIRGLSPEDSSILRAEYNPEHCFSLLSNGWGQWVRSENSLCFMSCAWQGKNVAGQETKKDIKGSQLKEVRSIRGLALPSKMPGTGGSSRQSQPRRPLELR